LSFLGIHSGVYSCPFQFYWSFLQTFFFRILCMRFNPLHFWSCWVWEKLCCPFFHISCVSSLGFAHLGPSHLLEILITQSLSVEICSMFRKISVELGWGTSSGHWTGDMPQ
jgi:hypothetical protein